jgi:hypothetical protein
MISIEDTSFLLYRHILHMNKKTTRQNNELISRGEKKRKKKKEKKKKKLERRIKFLHRLKFTHSILKAMLAIYSIFNMHIM